MKIRDCSVFPRTLFCGRMDGRTHGHFMFVEVGIVYESPPPPRRGGTWWVAAYGNNIDKTNYGAYNNFFTVTGTYSNFLLTLFWYKTNSADGKSTLSAFNPVFNILLGPHIEKVMKLMNKN